MWCATTAKSMSKPMTKATTKVSVGKNLKTIDLVQRNLAKRKRAEWRFRAYGVSAILFGLVCLLILFGIGLFVFVCVCVFVCLDF